MLSHVAIATSESSRWALILASNAVEFGGAGEVGMVEPPVLRGPGAMLLREE